MPTQWDSGPISDAQLRSYECEHLSTRADAIRLREAPKAKLDSGRHVVMRTLGLPAIALAEIVCGCQSQQQIVDEIGLVNDRCVA
jgi:hypothetical protein